MLYDIRTNSADSSIGKSRTFVNLVINAVTQPILAPINSDNINILQKSPSALKKAFVSKPPVLE